MGRPHRQPKVATPGATDAAQERAPAASLQTIGALRRRLPSAAEGQLGRSRPREVMAPETAPSRPEGGAPGAPNSPRSIADYWSRLRGERPCPAPADLDPGLIAANWPNAVLLRRHDGEAALRATALYGAPDESVAHTDRTLDMSPAIVEWLLVLAAHAVAEARPITEQDSFERPCGSVRYLACALPLASVPGKIDHALCYLRVLG